MKNIVSIILLFVITMLPVIADEVKDTDQLQEAKDIKGAIVIKKQPTQDNATQVQRAEKIYGSIIIFVQGKCPFDNKTNEK